MSKPLKQKCSDLQALKFFEQCRDEINKMAKSYNKEEHYKKQLAKVHKRIQNIETVPESESSKQSKRMLLNNIVIDYLGSCKYNYTYPVFMRECNIISEQIVNKKRLSSVLGIQEEYCKNQRFDISILELMIQKIQTCSQRKSQRKEQSVQVELIKKTKQQNNTVFMENKYRQIRQQIEKNQKKHYQKQLQFMKTKQMVQLRSEVSKEYEQKYNKQKQKVNKKYQEMIEKSKSMNSNSIVNLEQQNVKLLNKNYQLSQEVSKMKKSLQQSQLEKSKHSCLKNTQYIEQKNKLINERKQLERKKQQFDLALRGISTKIQDIAQQKIELHTNKNNTEQFVSETKVHRQNKDYMIDSLYSEMKKMDNRVRLLSQQNTKLRDTVKQQSRKIKDQQGSLVQLKQKSLPTSSIINQLNQLREESVIDVQMTRNIDNYIRNQNIMRNQYDQTVPVNNGNFAAQVSEERSKNPLIKKCKQCKNWVNKPKTLTVSTNVTQQDLQPYIEKQVQKNREKEAINDPLTQSESDFQAKQDMELEHKNRLAQLMTDMKKIKNKVLLLVNMDI